MLETLQQLPVVDALRLPLPFRRALKPGEALQDESGTPHDLPRIFYQVPSWEAARDMALTTHFHLWEFMAVDFREAPTQRSFPRYIPCAVTALAAHLELLRQEVGTLVHIAANGGYRSPGHRLTRHASTHCWGTAANIYRIGNTYLDVQPELERYAAIARAVLPGVWIRPYGSGTGAADDHLHLDIGWAVLEPRATADTIEGSLDHGQG